jgi:hypothetical protein
MYRPCLTLLATLLIGSALSAQAPVQGNGARIPHPDHSEFEASLGVPFKGDQGDARVFTLHFSFQDAEDLAVAAWRVELTDSRGIIIRTWRGEAPMANTQATVRVPWDGLDRRGKALPAGHYRVRMMASSMTQAEFRVAVQPDQASRVEHHLANAVENVEDQTFDIQVGRPAKPAMPAFRALSVSASGDAVLVAASKQGTPMETSRAAMSGLPYTIYFGNLHSQTNHSDGGGEIATCSGAHAPQSGTYGPAQAFQFALTQGLDLLMCSEHNHMYDGSTGTNTAADPLVAHNLYQSGLSAASTFNAAHPGFLGIYGLEWGVISNGGHLNIFNADGVCNWESNSSGQLIGDYNTPKNDYAGLYTLMRTKGWLGQFNHPSLSGQFLVGGTALGYTADGDEAMALCEVLNTSAFSVNLTETETGHSSWEQTFNALLAYGYHLAPSTDQDNHCANWGASSTNRTGVLIPTGTALTTQSFLDAVKARRVYATMDKNAQIILTANGHVMGERFTNSGPLTLTANYASANGHTVSMVQVFDGVPGSGVAVSQTSTTAVTTITPTAGEHFYYAKITQDNGDMLWSAPVWVTQGTGTGDTQAPVVSVTETGTSGTITFNATATDNVGVAKVEFYVDGALKGTSTTAPYTMTLNSTTLTNAAHSLTAKAYDAANNIGTSTAASFTISNTTPDTTAPVVSATEVGTSGTITFNASATDNVGVTKVEFYVDGLLKGTSTAAPYTLAFNSTALTNAAHSLTAKAYDAANNIGTSTAVSFTVSNTTPDTTAPLVSATEVGTSGTITFNATATDNIGVVKVEFYVDGVLKGTDTASPYTMTLDSTTLTNAAHALTVKAYDAANNIGTSTAVSFTISNVVATTFNEVEPNDTQATANAVGTTSTKIVGYFKSTTDNNDYFNVTLLAGHTLIVDMVGPTASAQDYDLYLLGSTGTQLTSSTGSSTTEHVTYKNTSTTASKVITIRVSRYASYSSVTPYTLTMTR